jgi:hypothetical protein
MLVNEFATSLGRFALSATCCFLLSSIEVFANLSILDVDYLCQEQVIQNDGSCCHTVSINDKLR